MRDNLLSYSIVFDLASTWPELAMYMVRLSEVWNDYCVEDDDTYFIESTIIRSLWFTGRTGVGSRVGA